MATSPIDISAGFLDEPKRKVDISAGFEQAEPVSAIPTTAAPRPSVPAPLETPYGTGRRANIPEPVQGFDERFPISARALDVAAPVSRAASTPVLSHLGVPSLSSPEGLGEKAIDFLGLPKGQAAGGIKGQAADAIRILAGLGDFIQTPTGIATAAALGLSGGTAAIPISLAFAASMGPDAVEAGKRLLKEKSPEALQDFLMITGMITAAGAGAGAPKPGIRPLPRGAGRRALTQPFEEGVPREAQGGFTPPPTSPAGAITPRGVGLPERMRTGEVPGVSEKVSLPTPGRAASPTAAPALPSTASAAQQTIEAAGARYRGIQKGIEGMEERFPDLALFNDPKTGSTLALPVGEVTPQAIAQSFRKSRAAFERPRQPLPDVKQVERRQVQRDPAQVRAFFEREAARKRQAGPKPAIAPELVQKLADDVQTVRETGTISEGLKPEAQAGARGVAAGKAGPAEAALENARQSFVEIAEELAKAKKSAEGNPGYQAAIGAAEQQMLLAGEEFLLARRDPAMAMRLLQEPLHTKMTPAARKQAHKAFKESNLPRTEKMVELLRELKPGWSDMFLEAWKNGLLSGPPTHAVNFQSNLTHTLWGAPQRGMAGGIDFFRAKLTGTAQERFIGEAAQSIYGMTVGLQEGGRAALRAFITERPAFGKTRIELPRHQAIPGRTGEVIRAPGRLLLAADEFAKQVNYSASIHAQAYRTAVQEGKTGLARAMRTEELVKAPTETMIGAAQADAIYRTFQKELGPVGRKVSGLREAEIMGAKPGHLVVPFLRTLLNLPKVALEHTPLNFIRIAIKRLQKNPAFMAGNLSEELAKPVLGTMVGYLAYDLASRGLITGSGPSNLAERGVWLEMYQPNSIKVGDQWINYSRLDPYSTHLGMAADLFEAKTRMDEGEFEEAATKMALSFTRHVTSRTWAMGMSDALNAAMDPDRYGERWTRRLAGSMVPTGVAQIARAQDPTYRQPRSVGEAVKARIPGLAEEVEPLRGVFGETVPRDVRSPAERMFSPFARTAIPDDPATREIVRLKMRIGRPSRQITIRGEQREMTREEYERYQTESGERAQERINRLVADPNYQRLTDEQRERRIKRIFDQERDRVRRRIAAAPPPVRELVSQ